MPHLQRKVPGRTIKRSRNMCRVVVTFEVEVPENVIVSAPSWKRHAMHYFRDLLVESGTPQRMIATMRRRKEITIVAETVEVCS